MWLSLDRAIQSDWELYSVETLSKVQHVVDNLSPMAEGLYFLTEQMKQCDRVDVL